MGVIRNTPGELPKPERNTPKEMVSARLSSDLMARVAAFGAEFSMTKTEALERLLDRGLAFGTEPAERVRPELMAQLRERVASRGFRGTTALGEPLPATKAYQKKGRG